MLTVNVLLTVVGLLNVIVSLADSDATVTFPVVGLALNPIPAVPVELTKSNTSVVVFAVIVPFERITVLPVTKPNSPARITGLSKIILSGIPIIFRKSITFPVVRSRIDMFN